MCQHNLPCTIVYAYCLLPGRAFASLYVLLFLEKEAEIGGRVFAIFLTICDRKLLIMSTGQLRYLKVQENGENTLSYLKFDISKM